MWKKVGSVQSGDDKSIRSNKSRIDINPEPFHQSIKRRSNISPEANRSFCYDYFEKRRNNTLNMTIHSNKSEKDLKGQFSKEDIFTEMRNRGSKEDIGSRIDSVRENPEGECSKKGREGLKQAASRLHNLKKEQSRLKQLMEKQFNGFKNFFYQIQQKLYSSMNETQLSVQSVGEAKVDEFFIKDVLGEALEIERFFGEMQRKKALIMQQLSE